VECEVNYMVTYFMLGFDRIGVVTTVALVCLYHCLFVCYEDGLQCFASSDVLFISVLQL
jgi:hypothetical protein